MLMLVNYAEIVQTEKFYTCWLAQHVELEKCVAFGDVTHKRGVVATCAGDVLATPSGI